MSWITSGVCDCSIYKRRGALIHRVPKNALCILTPLSALNVYQWHTLTAKDFFCPTCGILPCRRPRALTDEELKQGMEPFPGWSVNVRCLDEVVLESVPIRRICGSKLP